MMHVSEMPISGTTLTKPVPADVIVGIAKLIGIDVINEPQYLWIAESAAMTPLPEGWREFEDTDGTVGSCVLVNFLDCIFPR